MADDIKKGDALQGSNCSHDSLSNELKKLSRPYLVVSISWNMKMGFNIFSP